MEAILSSDDGNGLQFLHCGPKLKPRHCETAMAKFQALLEHLCMGLIGDTTVQWDAPHVNEIMSSPRHTLKRNMYSKRRICVECKAAAGPGVKIHGSFHGCEQCGVAVHLKCISYHSARANKLL